ncbi:MAG TPA: hypothetical protein VIB79_15070 [Candidatus Binatia bacterium]|jgi:hypothetical protein
MKRLNAVVTIAFLTVCVMAWSDRAVMAQDKTKSEKAKSAPADQKNAPDKSKGETVTKVLFENEKYRVVETRSKPGQRNEMKARSDRVIYSFNPGKSRVHYPDGKTEDVEFKAGEVRFRKADKTQSENIGKTETRNLVITAK